jgi:hypothetical protein
LSLKDLLNKKENSNNSKDSKIIKDKYNKNNKTKNKKKNKIKNKNKSKNKIQNL